MELDAQHALPRLVVGHRALEARDVPAEAGPVVYGLDALGVLGRDEHEGDAGGRLGTPHVHRLLADVRVELDPPPPQGERLEGLGTLEKTELVGVGTETFPAPAAVLLTFGRPLVGELDGRLQGVEGEAEHNDHLVVLREVRRGLGADPGELVDREALLDQALHRGLEHVLGAVEHAMDELERRLLAQRLEHDVPEVRLIVELPRLLHSDAAGELTMELIDDSVGQTSKAGRHGDRPPFE